jgi:hypothetical protein
VVAPVVAAVAYLAAANAELLRKSLRDVAVLQAAAPVVAPVAAPVVAPVAYLAAANAELLRKSLRDVEVLQAAAPVAYLEVLLVVANAKPREVLRKWVVN